MALKYTAVIPLAVKVKGKEKQVAKGDTLPAGVDPKVVQALRGSGLVLVSGDDPTPPAVSTTEPATTPAGLPAERDTRELWEAYAKVVGVDPVEYSKLNKGEFVEVVTKAHEAKAKADGASGSGDGGSGS